MLAALVLMLAVGAPQSNATAQSSSSGSSSSAAASADGGEVTPKPDESGVYSIGHGVTAPKVVDRVEPEYSPEARRAKISGTAVIAAVVDTNGNPSDIHVVKSIADTVSGKNRDAALSLDRQAIEAIRQYKFAPAKINGVPVPVRVKIQVSFQILGRRP